MLRLAGARASCVGKWFGQMGMGGGLNSDGYFLSKAGQFWTTVIGTGEVSSPTVRNRKLPSLFGFAAEVQVARMVDFAHAAGAEGPKNLVRAEF